VTPFVIFESAAVTGITVPLTTNTGFSVFINMMKFAGEVAGVGFIAIWFVNSTGLLSLSWSQFVSCTILKDCTPPFVVNKK
jgi:hypothetical protein